MLTLLCCPLTSPALVQLAQPGAAAGAWLVTAHGGSGWEWEEHPEMGEGLPLALGPEGPVGPDPAAGSSVHAAAEQQQRPPSPPASPLRPCPPFLSARSPEVGPGGWQQPPVVGAVASSYRWCELVQVVDLRGELARWVVKQNTFPPIPPPRLTDTPMGA